MRKFRSAVLGSKKGAMSSAVRSVFNVVLETPVISNTPITIGTLAFVPYSDVPPSFSYSEEWLTYEVAFRLGPDLELFRGPHHPFPGQKVFGFMADASPDRWGQRLLARRESGLARREGRRPRALYGGDILLGVEDETRMGAIRYRRQDTSEFMARSEYLVPPLKHLRRLEQAARRFESTYRKGIDGDDRELMELFAPGSSMGGARPKAVVEHEGRLHLAKFPSADDGRDMGGWEYLVYTLARDVGVTVANAHCMASARSQRIFLSERFDRNGAQRLHYASAMTLLGRHDHDDTASYLDLAELVASGGARGHVASDLKELFTRVAFNVAVGNRDDHLRNHGFLRHPTGWRLSPAFDVNPNPERRDHQLAIDEDDHEGDLKCVARTCRHYQLKTVEAEAVIDHVMEVVGTWRERARAVGLKASEIELMEDAFIDPSPDGGKKRK